MIDADYIHHLAWCIQEIDNGQTKQIITDPDYGIQDNFECVVFHLSNASGARHYDGIGKRRKQIEKLLNHWKIQHLLSCLIYNEDESKYERCVAELLFYVRQRFVKELEREIEDSNADRRRDYRPL